MEMAPLGNMKQRVVRGLDWTGLDWTVVLFLFVFVFSLAVRGHLPLC
jgi:hypothetical protein